MKPVYDFSSVSPTSLTLGYGENVCNVLLHFADCALHAINYESVPLVRSSFDETENERAADETSDVVKSMFITLD